MMVEFHDGGSGSAGSSDDVPPTVTAVVSTELDAEFEVELAPGSRIGRFVVEQEVGVGGMGRVYRAHDPKLDRVVALKLMRHRASNEDQLRVAREAQAMAALSHPNIVAVFDIGEFDGGGRPCTFIAMELVVGETLSRWSKARLRELAEILMVFEQAGAGLHAAHVAGIVHRDFKPSNVLVDEQGRARVLDFGLARASERPWTEPSGDPAPSESALGHSVLVDSMTMTGVVVGTPAYMAPEQHEGQVFDPRCDQYAFCVALWEAVTGQRPFRGRDIGSVYTAKRRATLPPADEVQMPRALHRALVRGLSPDPDDRYASMALLLEELRALRPRRRRGAWLGAGAVVLVGGALAVAWLGVEPPAEPGCDGASARLEGIWDEPAKKTARTAIEGTGLPYAADTWQRTEARISEYAARWATAHTEACEATRVEGVQGERVMDQRMRCLDDRLGHLAGLVDMLRAADAALLPRVIAAADGLPSIEPCGDEEHVGRRHPVPGDAATRQQVDALRAELGRVWALDQGGRYAEALELSQGLAERASAVDYPPLAIEVALTVGSVQNRAGRYEDSAQTLRQAYFDAKAQGLDDVAARAAVQLTYVMGIHLDRAEEGLDVWAKHAIAALDLVELEGTRESLFMAMAIVYRKLGQYEQALAYQRQALELLEGTGPQYALARSNALQGLGIVLCTMGRQQEGIGHLEQALSLRQRALGPLHPRVAQALVNIGTAYSVAGDQDRALEHQRGALSIYEQGMGADHPSAIDTRYNIANTLQRMGELSRALEAHVEVLARYEAHYGTEHRNTADSLYSIGRILHEQGEYAKAEEYHSRARVAFEAALGAQHPYVADAMVGLGRARLARGEPGAAVEPMEQALAIFEAVEAPGAEVAAARFTLAKALDQSGKEPERVPELARQAREGYASASGEQAPEVAQIDAWLSARRPG